MTIENRKDHLIDSFLDSLYIEKGLSNNTVSSYKNDIKSFFLWLDENSFNPLNINASTPIITFLNYLVMV